MTIPEAAPEDKEPDGPMLASIPARANGDSESTYALATLDWAQVLEANRTQAERAAESSIAKEFVR